MAEINTNINTQSHYDDTKVKRAKTVAQPPASVPKNHLFSDSEANAKITAINQDIYEGRKDCANKDKKYFWSIFGTFVLGILAYKGIRTIFKK